MRIASKNHWGQAGDVAQLAERWFGMRRVVCSNPARGQNPSLHAWHPRPEYQK